MVLAGYAPEGAAAAVFLLAPAALGIVSLWPSARGHWSGPVLAAPSLLFGLTFAYALFRAGPGYGGWAGLWERRRASRQ